MSDRPHRLTRLLSFVLRHRPDSVGVKLDQDGWTDLKAVVRGLQGRAAWTELSEEEVVSLLEGQPFTRFEIDGTRIRALYGHSLRHVSPGKQERPPELLFHATRAAYFNAICAEGIAAKSRSHAHLTSSLEYALNVKNDHERSGSAAIIFGVQSALAAKSAIPFYRASEVVWTAPYIPPSALALVTTNQREPERLVPLLPEPESALFLNRDMASFSNLLREDDASE